MLKFCALFTLVLTACQDVLFDEYEAGSFASTALFMPFVTPPAGELTPFAEVTPQIALCFYKGALQGEIWYTTDGSDPTPSAPSIRYNGRGGSGPFTMPLSGIPMTATLKAIIHRDGYMDSPILTAVWKSALRPASWTAVTTSNTGAFNKVCYGVTAAGTRRFVAAGNGGYIAYSTDGITWTAVSNSPTNSGILNLCYGRGAGRFVVVGEGNLIAHSTDGITWTAATSSGLSGHIYSVCYGDGAGRFVATDGSDIAYSANGTTWTAVSNSPFTSTIESVCYGAGKFVVVNNNGKTWHSVDGMTWTTVSNSPFTGTFHGLCYGAGKFVAVGESGKIMYSADGITWTTVAASPFTNTIFDVCYGAGKFVAVGAGGKMAYSADGIGWTALSPPFDSNTPIHGVCYGDARFVAVGGSGKIACSTPQE